MAGLPLECVLMLGYALSLALIAFLIEWMAGHAHRRSLGGSTAGFTYYPDRDVSQCSKDQHLFPVFSDSIRGTVTYRAPAAACNAGPSKAACTDSSHGREIERNVESEMKRFHRAVSLTLLALASLILFVKLVRPGGLYSRIVPASALTLSCVLIQCLAATLSPSFQH